MIERASHTVNGYEGWVSAVDSEGRTIFVADAPATTENALLGHAEQSFLLFEALRSGFG